MENDASESEHPTADAEDPSPFTQAVTDHEALFAALCRVAKLAGRNFDGLPGLPDASTEGVSAKYIPLIEFANVYKVG